MKYFILCFLATIGSAESFTQLIYELRDPRTSPAEFRICLEKVGKFLALDLADKIETKEVEIRTSTGGIAKHALPKEKPVLVTIVRSGIPLMLGALRVFPDSEVGFIGLERNEETFQSRFTYVALPDLKDRIVILIDSTLAASGTILDSIQLLQTKYPKQIVVMAAIASQFGIDRLMRLHPYTPLFIGAVDPALNADGYIVPGLGDAGARSFGIENP